jgi:hypothetical protein
VFDEDAFQKIIFAILLDLEEKMSRTVQKPKTPQIEQD